MKKNILVNATSLASGGGFTVLNQFMADLIDKPPEEDVTFYVFVPDTYNTSPSAAHIHCLKNSENPFYKSRNYWNLKGIRNWVKHKGIDAHELFSLQNYFPFGFRSRHTFKRLYLHQPIPFFEYTWSPFKDTERKLWFYQNIYYQLIKSSVKQSDQVIVQTQWFKKQLIKKTGIDENKVIVNKPVLNQIDPSQFESIKDLQGKSKLFYPADDYVYKNHEILYKAMDLLVNGPLQNKDLVLYVTLEKDNKLAQRYITGCKLEKHIILTGKLRYDEVMRFYKSVDALMFPSKIETFGLPLLEAKAFGLPVIASDLPLYREVIGEYGKPVVFCNYSNVTEWAHALLNLNNEG